ncbi:ABC transporter substrate-binding protein [Halorussus sp. AFM4]|uniref:ABC transporter substrate-binding protein n=1 Tax=Halorussus sp. AFM4 TaxID=3421651 RepID=UPI003EC11431
MTSDKGGQEGTVPISELNGPSISRRNTLKLLSAAGMAGLAGCSGAEEEITTTTEGTTESGSNSSQNTSSPPSSKTGGKMTAGWNVSEFTQIDPHYSTLTFSTQLLGNLFSGLVEVKKDLTIQGDLAKDWTVSDGGKTIEFQMVEDAHFPYNGKNVTAEDVEYSFRRVIEEETPHANKFSSLRPLDDGGIQTDGDYGLTLNFKQPFAPIFIFLTPDLGNAGAVICPQALEDMGKKQFGIKPQGSGPFHITKHTLGSTLQTKANRNYHKSDSNGTQLPYLDAIDFEPLKEASTRTNALLTGSVQFLNWPPDAQLGTLKKNRNVEVESLMGPNFGGLAFNNQAEPFKDKKVRLAVAKAIDEERYVKEALLGHGTADTGVYSPAHGWLYRDKFAESDDTIGGPEKSSVQRYDPEGARKLAKEAGVMGLDIEMTVSPPELRGAKVLRSLLNEELNWNVKIQQYDISTIFEQLPNGNYKFIPFGNSVSPDPDGLTYQLFGPPEETYNWWGPYIDDDLMKLLKRQRTELNREKRKQTLWKIEDMLLEEAPWAFFEHETVEAARRKNVKNYTHFGIIDRLRSVYLED